MRIRLTKETRMELQKLVESVGIAKVRDDAGRGYLFVPESVSLHPQDRPAYGGGAHNVPVTGLVYVRHYDAFGKNDLNANGIVYLPSVKDVNAVNDVNEYSRANYKRTTKTLLEANILRYMHNDNGTPRLTLDMKNKKLSTNRGEHGRVGDMGQVYFEFDTPNMLGSKGRISVWRDAERTLALAAEVYRM